MSSSRFSVVMGPSLITMVSCVDNDDTSVKSVSMLDNETFCKGEVVSHVGGGVIVEVGHWGEESMPSMLSTLQTLCLFNTPDLEWHRMKFDSDSMVI